MRNLLVIALALMAPGPVVADVKSKLAQEAAGFLFKKGSKEVIEHGVAAFARKVESVALKHGDDVFHAVKAIGPKALPMIEKAGVDGAKAAKVMAKYGEKGLVHVVERPSAMKLVASHGDDVAAALVKHPGVAEPFIEKVGASAIPALTAVGPRSARRLAIMAEGEAAKVAADPKLLGVIARFGEPAAEFVWKHKKALAVGAVLAAFLAEPQKFINGTKDITAIVADSAIKPLAEAPGKVLSSFAEKTTPEIARHANWTLIIPLGMGIVAGTAILLWAKRRSR